jgi:DNA gyrase/topoisomerase IV subunit B
MLYVELDQAGNARHLHYAPYLDYRPLRPEEPAISDILARPESAWIARDLERQAQAHAIEAMVPGHLNEVRGQRLELIAKTRIAVKDRLTKEINYWDHRAEELKIQEQTGKPNARLNSQEARRRADDLQARLQKRLAQLELEAQISALPPVVLGGLVVVPMGLLALMQGSQAPAGQPVDTQASAARARAVIMEVERGLGFEPVDRELEKLTKGMSGYSLQRYKGLGEMDPEQLWETTMKPNGRKLLRVSLDDVADADRIVTTLMGDKVDKRRDYIARYANFNRADHFEKWGGAR